MGGRLGPLSGTNWTVETVNEMGNSGFYDSLDIDAVGNVGIAYKD